ncbi:MAG: Ig-like domain-containing protein [Candidatus Sericytochromatia bacterium]|nr:Ig-like domain-containing protein [Candidatus Sericytochromatia bacterium]
MLRHHAFVLTGLILVSCTPPHVTAPILPSTTIAPAAVASHMTVLPAASSQVPLVPPPTTVPPLASEPLSVRIVFPAGAFGALQGSLRTQGLVTPQELGIRELARLTVTVNGQVLTQGQYRFHQLTWDGQGQLQAVLHLSAALRGAVAQVRVATPDGRIALQAVIPAGTPGTPDIDVLSTARSLFGLQADDRGVELLADLLTHSLNAGGSPNLLDSRAVTAAVALIRNATELGTVGILTVGSLPAINGFQTPVTGGSAGGGTPTPVAGTSVTGNVHDDLGALLGGVTVTGTVIGAGLFPNGTNTLSTTTQTGAYTLAGAPQGATLLVTATKAGLTSRRQTIVPLANPTGDPNINNVGFGGGLDRVFSLSDQPEVISFTPASNATGVDPATTFTLTFSEPVNTTDVETAFAVYVSGPRTDVAAGIDMTNPNTGAQGRYTLTCTQVLLYTHDPSRDTGHVTNGTRAKVRFSGTPIYDAASFTSAWSNNNQTVNFTFRPGAKLPTDKEGTLVPQYAVSFKDGPIRDAGGTARTDAWFRVSDTQVGRVGYPFTVATDTTAPQVSTITPINVDATVGATTADKVRISFSEPMMLFPGNMSGASIPGLVAAGSARLANNYHYYDSPLGTTKYPSTAGTSEGVGTTTAPGTWQATFANFTAHGAALADAGGTPDSAQFYSGDATQSTIQIKPRSGAEASAGSTGASQGFAAGRNVWIQVNGAVIDPAGNALNTTSNVHIRSGIAM